MDTYGRGWLAWGAALCERRPAQALADDLTAYQDRRTGGFWDSAEARASGEGLQGAGGEPSFELILNTVGNVVVGLAYYHIGLEHDHR